MKEVNGIPVWRDLGPTSYKGNGQDHVKVLIIGGGPIGLTLALDLGLRGQQVILIDQRDYIGPGSRAICFSKNALDIWDRLGVAQAMVEKGVVWNIGKVFYGDSNDPLYQFDMLPVKDQKNPGFINLQQYYAEDILMEAVQRLENVDVRWGHKAIAIDPKNEGAVVRVDTNNMVYNIHADWVIACDGNRSPVREMMGLDFDGRVFEDNFLIADVKFKEDRPSERWFWFDPPFNRGQSALLHKQPDDVWRLDFQLGWNIDREACIKPENVEPYVKGLIGEDIEFSKEWYSVYTFQCRRMKKFVHGRVIFAGDSAHLVSPFGARGANSGVADINNLAWKLDMIISGDAPSSLIDSYNYEAIVTADENILNSARSTDFITPKSTVSRMFRDAVLELAKVYPFARHFVNSGRLSTAVSYPDSPLNTPDRTLWEEGIAPGYPAVDAPLATGWLLDHLGNRFVLLTNGTQFQIDGVDVVDLSVLEGPTGLATKRFALKEGGAYLIRPDQYVAARWKTPMTHEIVSALNRAKGVY